MYVCPRYTYKEYTYVHTTHCRHSTYTYILHTQYTQYTQYIQHTQCIQYTQYTQYIQHTQYIQYTQYIQHTQCIQYTQYTQYIRTVHTVHTPPPDYDVTGLVSPTHFMEQLNVVSSIERLKTHGHQTWGQSQCCTQQ